VCLFGYFWKPGEPICFDPITKYVVYESRRQRSRQPKCNCACFCTSQLKTDRGHIGDIEAEYFATFDALVESGARPHDIIPEKNVNGTIGAGSLAVPNNLPLYWRGRPGGFQVNLREHIGTPPESPPAVDCSADRIAGHDFEPRLDAFVEAVGSQEEARRLFNSL